MKKLTLIFLSILMLSYIAMPSQAQQVHSSKIEEVVLRHEIDGSIGNTHVPEGGKRNTSATLILPNVGINYKYWFDNHFAIGLYNNIVVQTFVINSDSHQDLEREYPVIISAVGVFRVWKGLTLFTGPGVELDKNGSLFVLRFGLDYAFSLRNDWSITPRFMFDNIGGDIEAYTFAISVGRRF